MFVLSVKTVGHDKRTQVRESIAKALLKHSSEGKDCVNGVAKLISLATLKQMMRRRQDYLADSEEVGHRSRAIE